MQGEAGGQRAASFPPLGTGKWGMRSEAEATELLSMCIRYRGRKQDEQKKEKSICH